MALADLRRAGGKAIVLLNRRGWSNFLSCRGCGHVWMCPNCDVALVLHRDRRASSPAITAATAQPVPSRCGACGSVCGRASRRRHRERRARAARGARTRSFPVFRLDADSPRR